MASRKRRPTPPPPPQRRVPPRPKAAAGPSARVREREAARQAAARDTLRRRLVVGALVLAAVAGVGAYVVAERRDDARLQEELTAGSCRVDQRADPTSGAPGNHVPTPTYAVDPPAGGNHLGAGAVSSGAYAGARVPADGLLVHSLEHGYVVLWHQPALPPAELARLTEVQRAAGKDVVLVARASLGVPVAATAWGQRLLCDRLEPDTLARFVQAHVGNAPEDVPRT